MKKKKPTPLNEKKLRRKLTELTEQVRGFLGLLDRLMAQPTTPARGRQIADLCNRLQMYNDGVRYFWCDVDYRKDTAWTGDLAEPFRADARKTDADDAGSPSMKGVD